MNDKNKIKIFILQNFNLDLPYTSNQSGNIIIIVRVSIVTEKIMLICDISIKLDYLVKHLDFNDTLSQIDKDIM